MGTSELWYFHSKSSSMSILFPTKFFPGNFFRACSFLYILWIHYFWIINFCSINRLTTTTDQTRWWPSPHHNGSALTCSISAYAPMMNTANTLAAISTSKRTVTKTPFSLSLFQPQPLNLDKNSQIWPFIPAQQAWANRHLYQKMLLARRKRSLSKLSSSSGWCLRRRNLWKSSISPFENRQTSIRYVFRLTLMSWPIGYKSNSFFRFLFTEMRAMD